MICTDDDLLRGQLAHARLMLRQAEIERVAVARSIWRERVRNLAEQAGEDEDGHAAPAPTVATVRTSTGQVAQSATAPTVIG